MCQPWNLHVHKLMGPTIHLPRNSHEQISIFMHVYVIHIFIHIKSYLSMHYYIYRLIFTGRQNKALPKGPRTYFTNLEGSWKDLSIYQLTCEEVHVSCCDYGLPTHPAEMSPNLFDISQPPLKLAYSKSPNPNLIRGKHTTFFLLLFYTLE